MQPIFSQSEAACRTCRPDITAILFNVLNFEDSQGRVLLPSRGLRAERGKSSFWSTRIKRRDIHHRELQHRWKALRMISWHWFGIFWLMLGVVCIAAIELAARSSASKGPLSQAELVPSIAYCAALIAGAPLLWLFGLGISVQLLWRGRVPISNRVCWDARAAAYADKNPLPPSRETAICEMIEIRQRSQPRLDQEKRPSNWPGSKLWSTTEAIILDTVEQYLWLCDGGLTEKAAIQKIVVGDKFRSGVAPELNDKLYAYISHRLVTTDPDYLLLGSDVLKKVIFVAQGWTRDQIQRNIAEGPYPPVEWLKVRVSVSDIENVEIMPFKDEGLVVITLDGEVERPGAIAPTGKDWKRIKSRMLPTDELWIFSSCPMHWQNLVGRMGIALVRNGHPIAHVFTVIN